MPPGGAGGALGSCDLGLERITSGKVRDVFRLPPGGGVPRVLMVASDRISAFDVVMPTPIPGKGRLLTSIAAFWLRWIESRGLASTHLLSTDAGAIPGSAFEPGGATPRAALEGRVTVGRACRVLPVEFVARGYLEGSGWREYERTGAVCGVSLPAGLRRCERLPAPIFTPATKAERGAHDENIPFERAAVIVDAMAGGGECAALRDATLAIYTAAHEHALARGIILADTKFEFGLPLDEGGGVAGGPILIDEALTPDSSRFWPADVYAPGAAQPSYDKQFVREYLEGLVEGGVWSKSAPGPELPPSVVEGTLSRYREAAERLTA